MSHEIIAVILLVFVHLTASRVARIGWLWHGRFLSFAAGLSFAYVFVDLLPQLEKKQEVLKQTLTPLLPYLDRHAYVVALLGVLFFYGIHTQSEMKKKRFFWFSMTGSFLFNFFVGATLADSQSPDIQPLSLFAIALAMHTFILDHNATLQHPLLYQQQGRYVLILSLLCGYFTGHLFSIPATIEALVISFVAGGILLNTLHYELPKREQVGYLCFVTGALFYTVIILAQ